MRPSAFSNKGEFFKGNLHTHSTNSDGLLSPDLVCKKYKEKGYDFLCISDHFVGLYNYPITDTTNYRDSNFTTILGAEVHSGSMQNGEIWHLLAVGLPKDFKPSNSPILFLLKIKKQLQIWLKDVEIVEHLYPLHILNGQV